MEKQPLSDFFDETCKAIASWNKWKMGGKSGLSVIGYSRSADCTAFYIPELKWFLDAGGMAISSHKPEVILLTHGHSDHSFNLPFLISSRHHTDIYCPNETKEFVLNYINASQSLNKNGEDFVKPDITINGVSVGDSLELGKKKEYVVKIINCYHGVPCIGYMVYKKMKKLKPEYEGLPGKEIGQIRKQGIDVQLDIEQPVFIFLGDSSIELFENESEFTLELKKFPVVFIECTALDSDLTEDQARERGHIHWHSLSRYVGLYPTTLFVLTHFSTRYKAEMLRNFQDEISETHPNVMLWI